MSAYLSSSIWASSAQTLVKTINVAEWWQPSKLEYVEAGLNKFAECYEQMGITSISFPQLGTEHGGLDWKMLCPG